MSAISAGRLLVQDAGGAVGVEREQAVSAPQVVPGPLPDPVERLAVAGGLGQQHRIGLALAHRVVALVRPADPAVGPHICLQERRGRTLLPGRRAVTAIAATPGHRHDHRPHQNRGDPPAGDPPGEASAAHLLGLPRFSTLTTITTRLPLREGPAATNNTATTGRVQGWSGIDVPGLAG
jgi:hypothetical protein